MASNGGPASKVGMKCTSNDVILRYQSLQCLSHTKPPTCPMTYRVECIDWFPLQARNPMIEKRVE
jgi:hypothetical protein